MPPGWETWRDLKRGRGGSAVFEPEVPGDMRSAAFPQHQEARRTKASALTHSAVGETMSTAFGLQVGETWRDGSLAQITAFRMYCGPAARRWDELCRGVCNQECHHGYGVRG